MSRLDDLHIGKESSEGHAVHPQAWTRRKKKPQPLFTIVLPEWISRWTLFILLGNFWLALGIAMPVNRPFDAMVCYIVAIVCFFKAK